MGFRNIVIYSLASALALPAQQAAPAEAAKLVSQQAAAAAPQPQGTLKVNVLEGEGARNSVRNRTAVAPIVEVRDAAGKPMVGAEVVFQLPLAGPGGSFNGWLRSQTARTDESGKATVSGYVPNTEAGRYNIKVTATAGSQTGSAVAMSSTCKPVSGPPMACLLDLRRHGSRWPDQAINCRNK